MKDVKSQKSEDFNFEGRVLVPAFFHICGESQTNVDKVKKWIDDLISKELDTDIITDDTLLNLPDCDMKSIQDLQEKFDVKMSLQQQSDTSVDTENASLTIEGLSRDVLMASREVQKILRKSRERESLERQVELTSNLVEWQYNLQGQYQAFDPHTNFSLEQAKEKNQRQVEVTIQGQKYHVTLPNGPAVDIYGNQVELKRIDKLGGDISNFILIFKFYFFRCSCILSNLSMLAEKLLAMKINHLTNTFVHSTGALCHVCISSILSR